MRNKKKLHDKLDTLGFLFKAYRPECFFWEVLVVARKTVLATVGVFIASIVFAMISVIN